MDRIRTASLARWLPALLITISSWPIGTRTGGLVPRANAADYPIVDTGQTICYDDEGRKIICPVDGDWFYGQDAQYTGLQASYEDNGDGTVTDLRTGLMWQKTPDFGAKKTYDEALDDAGSLRLGGYDDWELPTLKQLYSLIQFYGSSSDHPPVPYIDTDYFDFVYGDERKGERLIDAQYWSRTEYVGRTGPRDDQTVFGVNFADGRIKGYPLEDAGGKPFRSFVRYVRNDRRTREYGVNDFVDNGDGTITDRATRLMWQQGDSGRTYNWQDALEYAEELELAGYSDWRLPNPKELQSIVDYTRAPDALDESRRGPAVDPMFDVTETESWYWCGTTHGDGPKTFAVYVCFGQAFGFWRDDRGRDILVNFHGAGAQRSDPKSGNPTDPEWRDGFGPQRDEIRIFNYVRAVRDAGPPLRGDMNCDGKVDFDDIDAMVTALIDRSQYEREYPGCPWLSGDCDCDGDVDFDDIEGFILCLGGDCPC
jgi:hypothetical protein